MRLPETIERLYLDFDGFFASVEQQADRKLRGRPIGIVPFSGTDRTCVIACSREAKLRGVKNVMTVPEARRLCPDILLVPQKPDLYRRAHNTLLAEIESVIPIDAVKSIDELTCKLDKGQRRDPQDLAAKLKSTLALNVGAFITCSIGFAANRQLAKIACKLDKPNGVTIWKPADLPAPLFKVTLDDIPGIGSSMYRRLVGLGIFDTEGLYNTEPKQMRKIWNNVTGERLWYALHGYDVQAPESERGMFGHGRVLPPESRTLSGAYEICRLLLIKAARRMRRSGFYCSGLWLWLSITDGTWTGKRTLPAVYDDKALLETLKFLWSEVQQANPKGIAVFRVGVTLYHLSPKHERQMDMLLGDDRERQRWEAATDATDRLNSMEPTRGRPCRRQDQLYPDTRCRGFLVMNWKTELQVRDLEPSQRLEMTCKTCGHVHYLTPAQIMSSPEREFLYLDEVERETFCKARRCLGQVRMALIRKDAASGFVGGLA